ncbi:hypothetical protein [uncultured Duncaniella sp.]|uniref:hypothetical protein n=1 Tax=uncultured Duncaniella sp. TaxID=2768039 RepID=UPI002626BB62|nr:hypothetical protein [uncultured Duncaniella sp.]
MTFPKYIRDILDRSKVYTYKGYNGPDLEGYAPGYVLKIQKYSHHQLMPTFQKEMEKFVAWINKQPGGDATLLRMSDTVTVYKQMQYAYVRVYDPYMKWIEDYWADKIVLGLCQAVSGKA